MLSVGSLFSGIGGFDLGLERAGAFRTAWFCEQDEFCQRVLAEHWPGVPCYPDVTGLRGADVEPVDVLVGGFPCQPVSRLGLQRVEDDTRWLWPEFGRLIRELRPSYVLVENVPGLLDRGLGRVLGDLAAIGYDAEWSCVRASTAGASHHRDRFWLVAYPQGARLEGRVLRYELLPGGDAAAGPGWLPEPDMARVAHGVPGQLDRVYVLGNALTPPLAEWLGRCILAKEKGRLADAA